MLCRVAANRVGYRYDHRQIIHNVNDLQIQTFYPSLPNRGACAGQPSVSGVCTVDVTDIGADNYDITGHGLLAGFSARPTTSLRMNFDVERLWNDNSLTRLKPRHEFLREIILELKRISLEILCQIIVAQIIDDVGSRAGAVLRTGRRRVRRRKPAQGRPLPLPNQLRPSPLGSDFRLPQSAGKFQR